MESECFQEYKSLASEVTKGMEQVKQLKASSSSNQERILERMLASYEEALLILNRSAPEGQRQSVISSLSEGQHQSVISSSSDPPGSSMSECKVTQSEDSSRGSWKRKSLPSWTHKVSVRTGLIAERLDDGYSWRRYGQKDILGSKYPRGYYRCAHRFDGCCATKQVQRLDDDPSTFEITYRGVHTCLGIKPVAPKEE